RLLKEGGRLFILDPLADAWIVKLADQFMRRLEPAHVKIYSTKEFQRLFEKAGLKYSASRLINWHQAIHIGEK
ncbi:MAG TPA: methyltransferase domain-containing protein, partial [Anaerolineales bacterium]|nr:methyltransferase domain-containing protein [Anaerolineales bacterium]